MKMKHKILIVLLSLSLVLLGKTGWSLEYMDGQLSVNGFFQSQFRLHIAQENPNNNQYGPVGEGNHDINMFRNIMQFEINYAYSPTFNLFAKIKAVNEASGSLDSKLRKYESHPMEYPGDLKLEDNDNMVQMQELYADITIDNLWLRLGKQQVAWGQTDGFRLLDIVNPVDLSWRVIADAMYEGHDNVRESLWMIRANYSMEFIESVDNAMLELLFLPGQFVRKELPAEGSPYNIIPTVLKIHHERPDGPEWGVKLYGLWKRFEISLNYFRGYSDDAVAIIPGTTTFNGRWGVPLGGDIIPPAGIGKEDLMQLNTLGRHPLMHHIGFSLSYDDNEITKSVYRFEFLYEPNRPYERGVTIPGVGTFTNAMVERIGTIKYCFGIDRPTWIRSLNRTRTFAFGFQIFQTIVTEDHDQLDDDFITLNGGSVQSMTTYLTASVDTQYKQDRIHPILFLGYDLRGGYWIAPQCEFIYGDNWRFYVMGTFFGGGDRNPANDTFGGMYWWDDIMFRVTYQF